MAEVSLSNRSLVLDREQAALLLSLAGTWSELNDGIEAEFAAWMQPEGSHDPSLSAWVVPADPAFFLALGEAVRTVARAHGAITVRRTQDAVNELAAVAGCAVSCCSAP